MPNSRATFAQAELLVRAVEIDAQGIPTAVEPVELGPVGLGPRISSVLPLADALRDAIRSTLEVMFFVDVYPEGSIAGTEQDWGAGEEGEEPSRASGDGGEEGAPSEKLWVSVGFQGTRAGCMVLGLEMPLAEYCHEGFQPDEGGFGAEGADPDSEGGSREESCALASAAGVTPSGVQLCVLELANIVCGSFISNAWPHGLFRVEEPRLMSTETTEGFDESEIHFPLAASCRCQTAEGGLEVRTYLEA